MSSALEAMPLAELPDLQWSEFCLAASSKVLPRLTDLLRSVPAERLKQMRAHLRRIWPRMLYTSLEFSELLGRDNRCSSCSPYWRHCEGLTKAQKKKLVTRELTPFCALREPAFSPVMSPAQSTL